MDTQRTAVADAVPPALPASVPGFRMGRWSIAIAGLVGMIFGASAMTILSFGIFIRPLEAEFGWSRSQVAFSATIISYTIMLLSPLQGVLTDRYGARRVILCSIPLFCLSYASLSLMPANLTLFYGAWILVTICGLGIWPLSYNKIAASWFEHNLGLAVGVVTAGVGVGGTLVPLIGQALISEYGWRMAFVGLAAVCFLVTFPTVLLFLRDRPRAAGEQGSGAVPLEDGLHFREALRTPTFWILALSFCLLGIISTGIITHQVPMLIDLGMAPQQAVFVQSTFGIWLIVGRLLTGVLLDRFFAPRVMAVFAAMGVVAFAAYAVGVSGWQVFACSAVMGLIVGAEHDVLGFVVRRYFGNRSYGRCYGVLFSAFQLGGGLGALALGLSRTNFGAYGPGLWGFAGLTALAILLFLLLGPYRYTPETRKAH